MPIRHLNCPHERLLSCQENLLRLLKLLKKFQVTFLTSFLFCFSRYDQDSTSESWNDKWFQAQCCENLKLYSDAISYYEKIISSNSLDADAHLKLGRCFYFTANAQKALYHYKKCIEIIPNNIEAIMLQVGVYFRFSFLYWWSCNFLFSFFLFLVFIHFPYTQGDLLREANHPAPALECYQKVSDKCYLKMAYFRFIFVCLTFSWCIV